MAFPETPVLDNFNRANSTTTIGGDWTPFGQSGGFDFGINSNQAYNPDGAGGWNLIYYDAATFGPDCEAYVTIDVFTTNVDTHLLMARFKDLTIDAFVYDGYAVRANPSASDFRVMRFDNAVGTTLGAAVSVTWADGDKIGIRCNGDLISAWRDDGGGWDALALRSDTTYPNAGVLGFYASDDTDWRLDDFGGGTINEEEAEAVTIPAFIGIPSRRQSLALSILVQDPIYYSTRSLSERITAQINSYSHELRAIGGYWSAKIDIDDRETRINRWIKYGLGQHIRVYNPALVVIWEGFINKVSASLGPLSFEVGPLLDIGNRISVTYSTVDSSVDPPVLGARETTAVANNTASQARYGIVHKIEGINGATATQAEQLRDTFVNDPKRAYPATSRDTNLSGSSGPSVSLECLGYWHWLKAYYYSNSATGDINLSQKIQDLLAADPNSIFSTDYGYITANTFQVADGSSGSETAETIMKRLNSYGDASDNPYVMGFYAGRKFVYQAAPNEIEYQQRIGANVGITNRLDGVVKPWDIEAGKWIFFPDFLIGQHPPISAATLGIDPRAGFNEVVKYSAPWGLSINGVKFSQLDQMLAKRGMGSIA